MSVVIKQSGNFTKTQKFLERLKEGVRLSRLDSYGRLGVEALAEATPQDTGETADSWHYKIKHTKGKATITWYNTKKAGEVPLAILLQYGHASKSGYFISGTDYINPAMKPVFEEIAKDAWKEVIANV